MKTPRVTVVLAFGLAFAVSRTSLAKGQFPQQVQRTLGLDYAPACTLCHKNGATGPATVKTPFGLSAVARGLNADDRTSVDASIRQMQADSVDSDGDNVTDIDELKAGTDPNTAANTPLTDYPAGGCCANQRTGERATTPTAAFVAGLAAISFRRKRNRA